MVNPNNVFFYRMTGNNTLDPLYGLVSWTSQGAADYTGQYSGYPVGTIINIQVDGQPWSQGGAFDGYTGPEGPASGDLAGNYPGPTVVGIQTIPVSSTPPTNGQVLTFSADFDQLQFITPASTVTFAGDLSGSNTDQTVVGIQTIPVDSTTPTNGQVLTFDADTSQAAWMTPSAGIPEPADPQNGDILFYQGGTWNLRHIGTSGEVLTVFESGPAWEPASQLEIFNAGVPVDGYSTLGVDGSTITLTYPSGIPTLHSVGGGITALTGDVVASGSGSVSSTLAKIDGYTLPSPTPGILEEVSGSLHWGTVNLASSTYVSGVLPTANQAAQTITGITGDASFTGTTASGVITLDTVNSNTGSYGNSTHVGSFTVNGKGLITAASNVLLPTSYPPSGTASGDLSGSYPSPTVVAIQGNAVSNSAPSSNNTLVWNSDLSEWVPSTLSFSGDVSGSFPDLTVVGIDGYSITPLADGYLYFNGTTMSWKGISGGGGGTISALTGDVTASGSGSVAATVKGIDGYSITPLADGYLYFNGTAMQWLAVPSSSVTWANDLSSSSNTHQYVSSISGSSGSGGTVNISASELNFTGINPTITDSYSAGGSTLTISTSTTSGSAAGNNISIVTGNGGSGAAPLLTLQAGNSGSGAKIVLNGGATGSLQLAGAVGGGGNIQFQSPIIVESGNSFTLNSFEGSGAGYATIANTGVVGFATGTNATSIDGYNVSPPSDGYLYYNGTSMSWSSVAGGSGITALTGDVTASGSGSVAATVVSLTGSSNEVKFPASISASSQTLLFNSSNGGFITMATPATSATGAAISVNTPGFTGTGGNTGQVNLYSGANAGLGNSGTVSIYSGALSGSSGASIYTTGNVNISTGNSSDSVASAATGNIVLQTGSVAVGTAAVGNIQLNPGTVAGLVVTTAQTQLKAGITHNTTIHSGSTYQILQSDYFVELTNTSSCTVTLPSTPVTGQKHVICGSGSGAPTIIVESGGSGNISGMLLSNGALTYTTAGSSVTFQVYSVGSPVPTANAFIFNGTYWYVAPGF